MAEGDYTPYEPTQEDQDLLVSQMAVLDAAGDGVGMDTIGTLYKRQRAKARQIVAALVEAGQLSIEYRGPAKVAYYKVVSPG